MLRVKYISLDALSFDFIDINFIAIAFKKGQRLSTIFLFKCFGAWIITESKLRQQQRARHTKAEHYVIDNSLPKYFSRLVGDMIDVQVGYMQVYMCVVCALHSSLLVICTVRFEREGKCQSRSIYYHIIMRNVI